MNIWQIQDAKSHLSQLIDLASQGQPQLLTKYGRKKAIVISIDEYEQLTQKQNNHAFIQMLLSAPKCDELDLTREHETVSEIGIFDTIGE